MEKPVTSEEKLLKLIRKSSVTKDSKTQEVKNTKTQVDFLAVGNRLLVFIFAGLLVYILVDIFVVEKQKKDQDLSQMPAAKENAGIQPEYLKEDKPYSLYENEFSGRNVFQYPWEKPAEELTQNGAQPTIDLSTVIKISGILLGESPQVIVEDINTHQTYFLSPGDSVSNAKVEEIKADKVIFTYNGNKVELAP